MISNISPQTKKLIILLLGVLSLSWIDNGLTAMTESANSESTVGSIASVNTQSKIKTRKPLPLAKGKGAGNGQQSTIINDAIFFDHSANIENKPVQRLVAKSNPIPDYHSLLKEKVNIASVSDTGAIINGRFYMIGQDITGIALYDNKGKNINPKLIKISENLDILTFRIGNKNFPINSDKGL